MPYLPASLTLSESLPHLAASGPGQAAGLSEPKGAAAAGTAAAAAARPRAGPGAYKRQRTAAHPEYPMIKRDDGPGFSCRYVA